MLKVSVITAVYNGENTVAEALDSVFSQTYQNIESIVIDGKSTDRTMDVLGARSGKISRLISERDNGIYDALNKGIRVATGDVIGFLHADDLFEDCHVIERIAQAFDDPNVDAVYGDLVYVRRENPLHVIRYWRSGVFRPYLLSRGWMPPHPTFYVRRSVYERFGSFDLSYKIAADYESILRYLGAGGVKCGYIPDVLVRMRVGGVSNRSISTILRKSREDFRALRSHKIGGLYALAWKNFGKLGQFLFR